MKKEKLFFVLKIDLLFLASSFALGVNENTSNNDKNRYFRIITHLNEIFEGAQIEYCKLFSLSATA